MPGNRSKSVQCLLLRLFGPDLRNQRRQIRSILLRLRPFRLGQEFVLQAKLGCAAEAVYAVVVVLGRETGEGFEDSLVLLANQVVGTAEAY